jgi:hypothetical protein
MTKDKLLKYFKKYLENEYCCLVDEKISDYPCINKPAMIKAMEERYTKLKAMYEELEKI